MANLVAGILFVFPVYFVSRKFPSKMGLIIACTTGVLTTTLFMSIFNYYYFLPQYAEFLGLDPKKFGEMFRYIAKTIIPFNLLKGFVNSVVFCMIYPRMKKWINK